MNTEHCLINQTSCGRVAGNPVCPKCGMDERVVYPGQADREAAQAAALARYEASEEAAKPTQSSYSNPTHFVHAPAQPLATQSVSTPTSLPVTSRNGTALLMAGAAIAVVLGGVWWWTLVHEDRLPKSYGESQQPRVEDVDRETRRNGAAGATVETDVVRRPFSVPLASNEYSAFLMSGDQDFESFVRGNLGKTVQLQLRFSNLPHNYRGSQELALWEGEGAGYFFECAGNWDTFNGAQRTGYASKGSVEGSWSIESEPKHLGGKAYYRLKCQG